MVRTAIIETDSIRIEIDFEVVKEQTEQHYVSEYFSIQQIRIDGKTLALTDGVPESFTTAMNERMEYEGNLDEY